MGRVQLAGQQGAAATAAAVAAALDAAAGVLLPAVPCRIWAYGAASGVLPGPGTLFYIVPCCSKAGTSSI
jgi:hypothetical protein